MVASLEEIVPKQVVKDKVSSLRMLAIYARFASFMRLEYTCGGNGGRRIDDEDDDGNIDDGNNDDDDCDDDYD